jgi:hypothetical protein
MQSFSHLLRLITTEYNLLTLITNTTVKSDMGGGSAFAGTRIKPALGTTWTFSPDVSLLMHRPTDDERVIVEVLRSRNGVSPLRGGGNGRNMGGRLWRWRVCCFGEMVRPGEL